MGAADIRISRVRYRIGLMDAEIEELYYKRLKDEVSIIEGSKRYADFVLRN